MNIFKSSSWNKIRANTAFPKCQYAIMLVYMIGKIIILSGLYYIFDGIKWKLHEVDYINGFYKNKVNPMM